MAGTDAAQCSLKSTFGVNNRKKDHMARPQTEIDAAMRAARRVAQDRFRITTPLLTAVSTHRHIVIALGDQRSKTAEVVAALRVMQPGEDESDQARCVARFRREHEIAAKLAQGGASVVPPYDVAEPLPVQTPDGLVGIWKWSQELATRSREPVDMNAWGAALATVHKVGSLIPRSDHSPYDPTQGFPAAGLSEFILVRHPEHVLHRRPNDVALIESALNEAFQRAKTAAERADPAFNHGDVHRLNACSMPDGSVLLYDLEYAGWGFRADDLSIVACAVDHYGWPSSHLDAFRRGLGPEAPTLEEIKPFAELRAVIFTGWLLRHAFEGADDHTRHVADRLAFLQAYLDGQPTTRHEPWTHVGDPNLMDAGLVVDRSCSIRTTNGRAAA